MIEPVRHRQTKEAGTDMFYLTLPRHTSTLPEADIRSIVKAAGTNPTLPDQWSSPSGLDPVQQGPGPQYASTQNHHSAQREMTLTDCRNLGFCIAPDSQIDESGY